MLKIKLFGVDNPKNTFTETEEVLMETSFVSSAINSESTISSNLTLNSNNTISSSSFVNNNTLTPSSISSNISIDSSFSSNVSNLNSLKSISFLDVLLGSIKVSAAESDYSWPWKFGETWNVNSGSNYQPRSGYVSNKWHAKVASEENETTNRGLDIMVPGSYWNSQNGNWNDIPVFAPKTGTITQLCTKNGTGGDNYFVRVDDMYIWHMTPQNFILNTSVKKSQQIGTVAIGSNRSGNIGQTGDYTTKCGSGIGAHLHIKFMLNNMNVDGTTMTWENDNYSSFTSQNSTNTTPYNNNPGTIKLSDQYWTMDVKDINPADGTKIQLYQYLGNIAQKWQYNTRTKQIVGLNDKCIDVGSGAEASYLTIKTCLSGMPTTPDGQRFTINTNNTISNDISGNCIDLPSGNKNNGVLLQIFACHGGWNQQWPTAGVNRTAKYRFKRANQVGGKSYCLDINNPTNNQAQKNWECNGGKNQTWETYNDTSNQQVFRRLGTVQCLNTYNPVNNKVLISYYCDNSTDQQWTYTNNLLKKVGTGANNQCMNAYLPNTTNNGIANNNNVNMISYACNTADQDQIFAADYLGS